MSHVLVITFPDENQATSVLKTLQDMKNRDMLNLDDAAVIVKDASGKVNIKNLTERGVKIGAVAGGFLGLVLGSLLFPLAGIALGVAGGALVGKTFETGLDKKFIKEVQESLTPGTSAILFIIANENVGLLITALEPYNGKIYHSSFDSDAEAEIRKSLQ
ncbi:MAG TPA: DUF1269 domain-containing protein [Anaerolineales bacterium]|nr:DUF1269 domain-containing protein [Anaerolineales bacterium]